MTFLSVLRLPSTLIEDIDCLNFLSLGSTLFTALQKDFESSMFPDKVLIVIGFSGAHFVVHCVS